MRDRLSVLTRKGQVTIPAEFRRRLGLRRGDRVAVALEGDRIVLRRVGSVVERTAGFLRSDRPPKTAEDLRAAAEAAIAEAVSERTGPKA
jgi:AbrB family looped-hinge helix DNA binding protein